MDDFTAVLRFIIRAVFYTDSELSLGLRALAKGSGIDDYGAVRVCGLMFRNVCLTCCFVEFGLWAYVRARVRALSFGLTFGLTACYLALLGLLLGSFDAKVWGFGLRSVMRLKLCGVRLKY